MPTQPTQIGEWLIEGLIGSGGMGAVYAAVHTVIGKRAALKLVRAELVSDAQARERFLQEARVVNQIAHPNIVDIFDIGELADGRCYLVMELLEGGTLGERLRKNRLAPAAACDVLLQICDGLAAAHAHGVVHRDLKPDNVVLTETPVGTVVKLVDWGIAKLMDVTPLSGSRTHTGTLLGTPQYMSPEQARARHVDGRTDVYALGAIAYELFLGRTPFQADNVADLVTMHLREAPPPPRDRWPGIPAELDGILMGMLAKKASERPSIETIAHVLRHLRADFSSGIACAASPIVLDRAPTLDVTGRPRPIFRRASGAAAAFTSIALVATATFVALRDPDAPASAATLEHRATSATTTPPASPSTVAPAPVPARAPTTLDLHVVPPNAHVVIDGVSARAERGHLVRDVQGGEIHLLVTLDGYLSYRRTLDVGPGTLLVDVALHKPEPVHVTSRPEGRRDVLDLDPDGTIDPFQ